MKRPRMGLLFVAALAASVAQPGTGRAQVPTFEVELEGGPAWQTTNDVEVPNDGSATRFSLVDLAGTGPGAGGRLYVTWNVSERHGLRLLLAPLTLRGTGTPASPLTFAGANYGSASPVEAAYTFNSYRLSYRWQFHSGARTAAWVGFTAKIRDATIRLEQGATRSRKDDLGFVPLLHVSADWNPGRRWRLSFDGDGLAGGPGRAVDASVKLGYEAGGGWQLRGGYRTVEGGADVASVYAFAWLHYATVSVVWSP